MPAAGGDINKVAGFQSSRLGFVGKSEQGFAADQHDPFGLRLVVPEPRRAGLAGRHDALDDQAGLAEQRGELFVGGAGRREMGEQVIEHGRPLLVEGKGIQAPFDLLLHGLERGALVIAETAAEFGVV